ncbi:OmpW/AlkL family protein [Luteimonas deserti]|uniref:OmpW family protein n=1 Tax=Luteimonas deserti TaxID=2752306 RepID=A0A7Z0QPI2_9GAMM|nr:OmpW family protein [Luteimonas deserti]NYZ62426.1 OmpW family protein [Luteimonas deserti]
MRPLTLALAAFACALPVCPAAAQSAGDWTFALGAHQVDPKSNNGRLANGTLPVTLGSSTRPTFALEYFVRDGLGIEVLAATPFHHDVDITGLGRVGSTKHLPPTVSMQYHFAPQAPVSPMLGVGVNYTAFFDEDTRGALAGSRLALGNSWGLAAHAGLDIRAGKGKLRIDARWIDIDSTARLDGAKLGTVEIDPLVYGAAYVVKF